MADGDSLVQKLQNLLKIKENELNESKKSTTRLESECSKLRKYNNDLIKQIDLTNHKLHVLLGVCAKREDKETQTEDDSSSGNSIGGQRDGSVCDQERVPLKAADWAKIAQEVVDSNDYVYEPTSKTYYSLSTGWYYYPNEKIFFDPKTKNYYRYDSETKNYVIYPVDRDATRKTPTDSSSQNTPGENRAEKEDSEEGEIVSSSEESDREDLNEASDVEEDEATISCLRMIVQKSSSLEIGSLLLVTCKGALLGKDSKCDLVIDDLTISPHHARIDYDAKFKCYQVIDCSSDHGVYLNDFKLGPEQSHNITHGDIIRLGDCEFLLHHHPGREVTCIHCEPGCVQAEFHSRGRYTPVGVIEGDTKTLNKRLKKMYGITWKDENIVSLPVSYSDRAKKRQKTVGSTNPHHKTGEGTSLLKPLTKKNRGFKMLKKIGWQEGNALGKDNSGNKEPLPLISSEGRYGLGYSGPVS
ncbi:angiogenic factor with G patch and FHA domains 1-like [Brevipalpus obovatus]|uniref:angiogenic factor with G patch and FHA domains 1-like n=1 Tax=Brevipalpus obovatus TaxID=246614 RepID=UPI003D9EB718